MGRGAKKTSGRFVKFEAGEKKVLQFNINKIKIVDSEFEGKRTGGKTIEYTVIEPKVDPAQEKILAVSIGKTDGINALLKKQIYLMEVEKQGTGKPSRFIPSPV